MTIPRTCGVARPSHINALAFCKILEQHFVVAFRQSLVYSDRFFPKIGAFANPAHLFSKSFMLSNVFSFKDLLSPHVRQVKCLGACPPRKCTRWHWGRPTPKKVPHEPGGFPILRVMFFFLGCPQDCCSDVFLLEISHQETDDLYHLAYRRTACSLYRSHPSGPLNFNHPPLKSQNTNCKQLPGPSKGCQMDAKGCH